MTTYSRSLAELFAEQVRTHPRRTAVEGPDARYTYAELGVLAERFARGLAAAGIGPGAVVGVVGQRGPEACAALLGVAYAGATYLPVDAGLPAERVHGMVADAGAVAVVRLPGAGRLAGAAVPVLRYQEVLTAGQESEGGEAFELPRGQGAAAYVMFTSGTTGRPKAVAVPQRGVARLAVANGFFEPGPGDRVLHAATLSFDASVLEFWPTLLNGACLVPVASEVLLSAAELQRVVRERGITALFLTTSIFHRIAQDRPETFAGLRYVLTGGEALRADAARRVLELGRPQHLVNAYGPTEAACVATAQLVTEVPDGASGVPIGRPIADTVCHVLREDGSPAADGEEGELHIGGGGIATGYLNDPQESARRFLTVGGADGKGAERLYRSGDFVVRRADGTLEYRGRRDDQVKVRGFRIEPEEVRRALTAHPDVTDAVLVAVEDGTTRSLAAYAAVRAGAAVTRAGLRAHLAERLPAFMLPATLTVLDRLPLAPNGKVDRSALPAPAAEAERARTDGESVAETVARVWAVLLPGARAADGGEEETDFFAAGGSSLLAVQLVARVQQELGIDDRHNFRLVTELLAEPLPSAFTAAVEKVATETSATGGPGVEGTVQKEGDRWRPDLAWERPTVIAGSPHPVWRRPQHVLLTGASGFFGAYLLRELLDRTEAQVHVLVRARDTDHAHRRLAEAQLRYGIGRPLPADRVRPLPADRVRPLPADRVRPVLGDLTLPRLGLSALEWDYQADGADLVVHCGAEVNFLYPYEKLRAANVYGTREVVRLASRRAVPLHHVSTVAVVHGMGAAGLREVTETTPLSHVELLSMGYTESKWVAEELVRGAGRAGLPVAVHRPYEISGDTTSYTWNSAAALCEFFRVIAELGLAPELDLPLNLVPVDFAAGALVHLATRHPAEGQTYHLTNPREAMLADFVERLRAHGHAVRTIGYHGWVDALLDHLADRPDHPFAPFAPLFTTEASGSGGVTVEELATARYSPRLDRARIERDLVGSGLSCPPVDAALLDAYIGYFHASGFIPDPADPARRAAAASAGSRVAEGAVRV
ncbi:amino acid adenylation domain-containing protein [Kitasatospora sp. NPDC051853]|uniref:amino acid adenylation domain-containing protein n=1 Tax=Kitasatospora sp. NPDC051853 TaxID=3364058 RepID=UPI0037B4FDFF